MATIIKKNITKIKWYHRREPKDDYMKNWRIIKYWAMKRYLISQADLELVLELYSEGLFTIKDFNRYCLTKTWNKKRLDQMIESGFIHVFKKRQSYSAAQYELTQSARKMCASIYRKLNGQEAISESPVHNPIYRPVNDSYSNRQLRKAIREVNIRNGLTQKPSLLFE